MDEPSKEFSNPEVSASSLRCSSHNYQLPTDISCCWVPPDNMHLIPHFQSLCLPQLDRLNSPEAHGCPTPKDPRQLAPVIGCPLDFFAQKQKCCTCPQHIKQLDVTESKSQALPLRGSHFVSTSSNCCIFLPTCRDIGAETKSPACQNVLNAHSRYIDNLISSKSSNGEDPKISADDEGHFKTNCEGRDKPGITRTRGKFYNLKNLSVYNLFENDSYLLLKENDFFVLRMPHRYMERRPLGGVTILPTTLMHRF